MKTILFLTFFVLTLSVNGQVKVGHNGDTINITALDAQLNKSFRDTLQNNLNNPASKGRINQQFRKTIGKAQTDSLNMGVYVGIDTNIVKLFKWIFSNCTNKKLEMMLKIRALHEITYTNLYDSLVIAYVPYPLPVSGGYFIVGKMSLFNNTKLEYHVKLKDGTLRNVDKTTITRATIAEINQYYK
jgi:hypothetical protein